MKTILIISDSHGHREQIEWLKMNIKYDYLFFLGDGIRDLENYQEDDKICAVSGNCDLFSSEAEQKIVIVENVKFLITHGHQYKVKWGIGALVNEGRRTNSKVVCYGHTHLKYCENVDGVLYLNPGALANGNYGIIEVDNGNILKTQIKNLY